MSELESLNPGDTVVIDHGPGCPRYLRTVGRVTKRFVELVDFSKWSTRTGNPYPKRKHTSGFRQPRLRVAEKRDFDFVTREKLKDTLTATADHPALEAASIRDVEKLLEALNAFVDRLPSPEETP